MNNSEVKKINENVNTKSQATNDEIITWKTLLRDKKTLWENLTRMASIWVMNLKSIILNKYILLEVLLFYTIAIVASMIILPVNICGGVFIILGVALPTIIILGAAGYNTRESTVYSNMNMSGTTRNLFYFGQLLTSIIIANILSLMFWSIVGILGTQDLFLGGWIWQGIPRVGLNPFKYWTFLNIIYITQVTAGVSFSTYFLISRFAKSKVSFYIMTVSILAIGLIFGGSINSYFNEPNNYIHYDIESIPEEYGYTIEYEAKQILVSERTWWWLVEGGKISSNNTHGIAPSGGLMPTTIFIPTLLNPFYGIGEFTTDAITLQMTQSTSLLTDFQIVSTNGAMVDFSHNGIVKWYSWYTIAFKDGAWMWTLVLIQPYLTALFYFLLGLLLSWINIKQRK